MSYPSSFSKILIAVLVGCGLAYLSAPAKVVAHDGHEHQIVFEALPDVPANRDFVVGPGKAELELKPGETKAVEMTIANRLGEEKTFTISLEDMAGSSDPKQTVVLLGTDRGPHSIRDFVELPANSITIPHGQRARFAVLVSVPPNAQPGGLYGSVVVGTATKVGSERGTGAAGSNPIITRIGTLLFVRVEGDAREAGVLKNFSLIGNDALVTGGPISFSLLYENSGNVHLNPYGVISVKNMIGSPVGKIEIEPWFALPDSLRYREASWNPSFLLGKYTAHAAINRGYDNIIDEITITFWVIPWKLMASIFVVLVLIIAGFRWAIAKRTIVAILFIASVTFVAQAESMTSSNYKIESDSMNFGGTRSVSSSYVIEDTAGEIATGISTSTSFTLNAGYQQMHAVYLAVVPAGNVTLSPNIGGLTGGTSNGSTDFTVTTDSQAGYTATIVASSSPALSSAFGSFADFAPGADPAFGFSVAANASAFGFSPEGSDIYSRFKDNGSACNAGSGDTANACWDGLSTTPKTIVSRTSSNHPSGTVTTLRFRAASGSSNVVPNGIYTATTTVTIIPS